MSKVKSGVILLVVGIAMNVAGRFLPDPKDLLLAILFLLWMIASLVVGVFGLFRLITGAIKKNT